MAERQAALQLRVLGVFELSIGDEIVRLPKKAEALLAFLAVRAQPAAKETVATLLWGNSGTEQARQSLRQCLVALRAALGPHAACLQSGGATLALNISQAIAVDAAQFIEGCQGASLPELEHAASLYRDVFLAGMVLPVEPFERWITIERQRFEAMQIDLLQRLAAAHAQYGEADKAIAVCRQLVALDPMREEAHRQLMALLANTGNRGGALIQYSLCVEVMREELGVEPSPETVTLAQTIRLGIYEPAQSSPQPVSFGRPVAGPLSSAASGPALLEKPSIAVVPFVNLSGDPARDYFVRGLVEDITVALGRERWLFVIAAPSALASGGSEADPREIGAKLGVQYVLKGSVRIEGGQVLFVVQLHDAMRGAHIWSGRFQDQIGNVFEVQDRLTTKVAATIAPALMSVEAERAQYKPTESLTAFDLYLRALPRFRSSKSENEQALALLDQALALDPSYAAAHAMAARCYQFQLMFGWRWPGDPGFAIGVRHGHEAANKGRNDSEALWMAGLALIHLSGEIDFSVGLIERSLTLNPNSANAWTASCLVQSYLGNADTAVEHFHTAQRLNPLDLSQHLHWNAVAWAYLGAGQYEAAAEAAERTLRAQPDYPPGLRLSAVTCGLLGRLEEARGFTAKLLAKQQKTSIAWMRALLERPLQRNPKALERYIEGARLAGIPETA